MARSAVKSHTPISIVGAGCDNIVFRVPVQHMRVYHEITDGLSPPHRADSNAPESFAI